MVTLAKYVAEPLWRDNQATQNASTVMPKLHPIRWQSDMIELAIEHTRDWLWNYAPERVRKAYKTMVTRSEVRRLECDLDELFTEALWS